MLLLGVIAITTLAANGARQLRYAAIALLAVSLAANVEVAGVTSAAQLAVTAGAGLVAATILYVAARDATYGEDPSWRLWLATFVSGAATVAAFLSFRTVSAEAVAIPLFGADAAGITVQVAAFWLLSSGVAILLSARTPARGSIGALLMITGVQLLVRLVSGSHLALTLLLAWLEVVIALTGAFLVVNERAAHDA